MMLAGIDFKRESKEDVSHKKLAQDSQEKSLADKKRAILIKNAYLGLEKVENCHKVKSQKMKDHTMLRILMRQYDRDRYITSLTTYRSQQVLKAKLGDMVAKSDLQLARVSGDKEKMKKLLTEMSEKQTSNLAGPTAVEEVLFQQVLESRRESLIDMRKPENYSKKGDIKGFWEEDEEFYKKFDGAIRNPFQMIDGMMEKYGSQGNRDREEKRPFARRTKSLSAVEKMSFTKQRDMGRRSSPRKSALPKLTNPLREITQIHEKTTNDLTKELEARQKSLYENIQPLVLEQDRNRTEVLRMLERFDSHKKMSLSNLRFPEVSMDSAAVGKKSRDEWKNLFKTSHTSNLTWKTTWVK